jgi:hypothetical protein
MMNNLSCDNQALLFALAPKALAAEIVCASPNIAVNDRLSATVSRSV